MVEDVIKVLGEKGKEQKYPEITFFNRSGVSFCRLVDTRYYISCSTMQVHHVVAVGGGGVKLKNKHRQMLPSYFHHRFFPPTPPRRCIWWVSGGLYRPRGKLMHCSCICAAVGWCSCWFHTSMTPPSSPTAICALDPASE